jgi:hypothetical protein
VTEDEQYKLLAALNYLKYQRAANEFPVEREMITTAIETVDKQLGSYTYINTSNWKPVR